MSRILIIDDDADVRAALAMVLELEGHTYEMYGCAREALTYQQQNPSDVIILDQMMPGMTGVEYCRELRALKDQTPVIFLSADRNIEGQARGLISSRVIKKPFEMDELLSAIRGFSSVQ